MGERVGGEETEEGIMEWKREERGEGNGRKRSEGMGEKGREGKGRGENPLIS